MSLSYDFKGKVALVTGANTGLAVSTAIQFAKSGASVVVSGQYADSRLTTVANECRNTGANVLEMAADPTREEDLQKLVDKTMSTFGRIDILVNCSVHHENALIIDPLFMVKYRKTMQTNLEAMVFMTSICVEHLEKTRGTIINISSIRSARASPKESAYCMAKSAIDMFTKCMATELGPKGIRVNSVNPYTWDPNNIPLDPFVDMAPKMPAQRVGLSDDLAFAVLFLAAKEASFITGTNMLVDGGHTAAGLP
ncbi:unnamed protein product [Oppiella nova]|uniref:Uncharacterized protein n=1 Tax=Oppiella nova TaxID=334625 RepID=A0A7R9LZM9_9ACAR|nr:unnamed protein product [Oppiella nova]CAG2168247.1 unnamed protein product [Oppiella nova]